MPNPHNPSEDKQHEADERERTMHESEWLVDIASYGQLGLAIASFNHQIGNESFMGTAEMKVENGIRTLEILLSFDETELHRCQDCNQLRNPDICTLCKQRVCGYCWKKHERAHWRPPKPAEERVPF